MWERNVSPSLIESCHILENAYTPVGRSIGLQFGTRSRIDKVFVEISEFEVHGLEGCFGERGASGMGSSWRPVPVFSNVERLEKRAEAIQMGTSRSGKT